MATTASKSDLEIKIREISQKIPDLESEDPIQKGFLTMYKQQQEESAALRKQLEEQDKKMEKMLTMISQLTEAQQKSGIK